jgi:hypothetical protein
MEGAALFFLSCFFLSQAFRLVNETLGQRGSGVTLATWLAVTCIWDFDGAQGREAAGGELRRRQTEPEADRLSLVALGLHVLAVEETTTFCALLSGMRCRVYDIESRAGAQLCLARAALACHSRLQTETSFDRAWRQDVSVSTSR